MVRRREAGFTLVELIVAVTLLAIVLGTVAAASVIGTNNSAKSQSQVRLAAALEQAVEQTHLTQPWQAGQVPSCAQLKATGTCSYTFNVSTTERFDFEAEVAVQRIGTGHTTFDVAVQV